MALSPEIRAYYTHSATMTSPGTHLRALEGLPNELGELCKIVQGLLLHEHWATTYKVQLSPVRRQESQLRSTSQMIAQILAHDHRTLNEPRGLDKRVVGVCRHFAVLTVALLRHQGLPARARCGFGAYFKAGTFEDHWVVEYWSESEACWKLADSQIDELQQGILRPDFPLLDVPRDRFVIAGDAWLKCRDEDADPDVFGIFDMRGMWFIAGNVLRDFAALNNMEMLPWDSWGAMIEPDTEIPDATLRLVDRVAELSLHCDDRFGELRTLYGNDERLRVPPMVYNALNKKLEEV
jgi:hypothetical protein